MFAIVGAEYRWPVRMNWVLISLAFFALDISTIRHSGLGWISSDAVAIRLIRYQYNPANAGPLTSWGVDLAQSTWLAKIWVAATLIVEMCYPIALFSRKARWIVVPCGVLILVTMALLVQPIYPLVLCQLFWAPWDRIIALCAGRPHQSNRKAYALAID